MANAVITQPHSSRQSIDGVTSRLRRLRGRITTWFVVDGLAKIAGALLLMIAVDLFLDWFFEMDRPQRIVMLGLMLLATVWMVWRFLIKPLRRHVSEDALCLQVENQNKHLGESLISALQFSRESDYESRGVSTAMVAATIDRGISSAESLSFDQTLHRGRFLLNAIALFIGVAALVGIGIGTQYLSVFSIWWKRNVLLDEDTRWPQKTVFVVEGVEDGVLTIPNGDDWLLIARVHEESEITPTEATIEIRRAGKRRIEVMQPIEADPAAAGDNDGKAKAKKDAKPAGPTGSGFHFTFQQVLEEFEFRIVSSSGRTEWIQVRLVDRPEVATLNLSITDPDYAGGRTRTLQHGRDKHYVLKGSTLRISGTASKSLAEAELLGGAKPERITVDGESFELELKNPLMADTTFQIRLIDRVTIKLPNKPEATRLESQPHTSFEVKLREDTAPKLTLKLKGVGAMVVPNALIPCVVDISDDFEISKIRLKYEWQDHSGSPPTTGSVPLTKLSRALADRNAEENAKLTKLLDRRDELRKQQRDHKKGSDEHERIATELFQVGVKIQQSRAELRSFRFEFPLDLKPLKIAENSNLRIRFEADDNDNVSGPKTGAVTESLEVVSEATLRNRLLERETRQRDILEKKRDQQDEMFTKTAEIRARIRNGKEVSDADRAALQKMHRNQQAMGRDLKTVADRLAAILDEYRNNRITAEEGRLKERQRKILDPLRKVADKPVDSAAKSLMQARGNLTEPQPRDKALADASKQQENIRDELNNIIAQMSKSANFQKAVNKAYQVKKAQSALLQQLNDFLKKQLNKLPDQ